jgi:dTDP-4-dehydrorhamnose reductase
MKAIVIGADGIIGEALVRALSRRGNIVYGTTRRRASVTDNRIFLDLAASDIESAPLPHSDITFFCAGIVTFAECRTNRALARQVNVMARASLARRMAAAGTRVVLLSTSSVFDGRVSHVPVTRPPCPINAYGEFAAEAEKMFGTLGSTASIVRFTKLITPSAKLIIGWIDGLSHGRPVTAFSELRMAPISLDDAIAALLAVADDPTGGIYQVSGAADVSYYDAARYIALRLQVDPALVVEKRAIDAGIPPEEIPRFSSLDTKRFTEITGRPAPEPFAVIDSVFGKEFDLRRSGQRSGRATN